MKFEFDSKTFSKKLRQKRLIDLDIDMGTASREMHISKATLSRIESGRTPDLKTYAQVCHWLGCDMATFVKKCKSDK